MTVVRAARAADLDAIVAGTPPSTLFVESAEAWAAAHGCTELASDTWIDADVSQRAHAALGFEEVDRCVDFRKPITASPLAPDDDPP